MVWQLITRPEAEVDIEASALWYEGRRSGLGFRFLDELNEVLSRVVEGPHQFPVIDKGVRRALLRRFPYGIYFMAEQDCVVVLAVLHLHRDPDTWRQRI